MTVIHHVNRNNSNNLKRNNSSNMPPNASSGSPAPSSAGSAVQRNASGNLAPLAATTTTSLPLSSTGMASQAWNQRQVRRYKRSATNPRVRVARQQRRVVVGIGALLVVMVMIVVHLELSMLNQARHIDHSITGSGLLDNKKQAPLEPGAARRRAAEATKTNPRARGAKGSDQEFQKQAVLDHHKDDLVLSQEKPPTDKQKQQQRMMDKESDNNNNKMMQPKMSHKKTHTEDKPPEKQEPDHKNAKQHQQPLAEQKDSALVVADAKANANTPPPKDPPASQSDAESKADNNKNNKKKRQMDTSPKVTDQKPQHPQEGVAEAAAAAAVERKLPVEEDKKEEIPPKEAEPKDKDKDKDKASLTTTDDVDDGAQNKNNKNKQRQKRQPKATKADAATEPPPQDEAADKAAMSKEDDKAAAAAAEAVATEQPAPETALPEIVKDVSKKVTPRKAKKIMEEEQKKLQQRLDTKHEKDQVETSDADEKDTTGTEPPAVVDTAVGADKTDKEKEKDKADNNAVVPENSGTSKGGVRGKKNKRGAKKDSDTAVTSDPPKEDTTKEEENTAAKETEPPAEGATIQNDGNQPNADNQDSKNQKPNRRNNRKGKLNKSEPEKAPMESDAGSKEPDAKPEKGQDPQVDTTQTTNDAKSPKPEEKDAAAKQGDSDQQPADHGNEAAPKKNKKDLKAKVLPDKEQMVTEKEKETETGNPEQNSENDATQEGKAKDKNAKKKNPPKDDNAHKKDDKQSDPPSDQKDEKTAEQKPVDKKSEEKDTEPPKKNDDKKATKTADKNEAAAKAKKEAEQKKEEEAKAKMAAASAEQKVDNSVMRTEESPELAKAVAKALKDAHDRPLAKTANFCGERPSIKDNKSPVAPAVIILGMEDTSTDLLWHVLSQLMSEGSISAPEGHQPLAPVNYAALNDMNPMGEENFWKQLTKKLTSKWVADAFCTQQVEHSQKMLGFPWLTLGDVSKNSKATEAIKALSKFPKNSVKVIRYHRNVLDMLARQEQHLLELQQKQPVNGVTLDKKILLKQLTKWDLQQSAVDKLLKESNIPYIVVEHETIFPFNDWKELLNVTGRVEDFVVPLNVKFDYSKVPPDQRPPELSPMEQEWAKILDFLHISEPTALHDILVASHSYDRRESVFWTQQHSLKNYAMVQQVLTGTHFQSLLRNLVYKHDYFGCACNDKEAKEKQLWQGWKEHKKNQKIAAKK